jgi:predicted  nucleic acid-binding Zn-ribbon protein
MSVFFSAEEKIRTEQVHPLQEQVKNLESGLDAMKEENEANIARIKSDFETKSEEYQRSIQATKEETKKLHGQAEFWKGKHSILQKELADLKDEISNKVPPLIKKQEEQQIEYSNLKKAHAKLEQQHQQLTTESKQQNDLHEQKCSSMSIEISHLTKEITDKKGQIDTLGNQLHATKEQLMTLEKNYSQACQYILEYRWCFYKALNGYRVLEQGFNSLDQRVKPLLPEKIKFVPGNGHAPVAAAANGTSLEATAEIQESERVPPKHTAHAKVHKYVRVKKRSPPSTAAPKETATKSAPLYVSFEQEVGKSGKHVNFYLVDTNEPGFPELKATNRSKVIDWGKGIIDHQS